MINKWFVLIIFLAILLRFPFSATPALNGDEGDYLNNLHKYFVEGKSAWESFPLALPMYFVTFGALGLKFFGFSELTLRSVSIFFGIITVFLIYYLTKHLFDSKTALLAALFAAIIPFFVLYSRDGHHESAQIFFTLLTIYLLEIVNSKKHPFICGVATGIAFSIKYNSALIICLYWIFKLFKERKNFFVFFKNAILINVIGIFVVFSSTFGFRENIFYLLYGAFFWLVNQSVTSNVPQDYLFAVLFEGFSPIFFIIICFAIFNALKHRTSAKMLCLWLFVSYVVIVFFQARKYPRHMLLGMPYVVILVAHYISSMNKCIIKIFLLVLAVFSCLGFSVYHIYSDVNNTGVRDISLWINENIHAGAKIYLYGGDVWPVNIYTSYKYNITSVPVLNVGDYVINYHIVGNYHVGSPLQNDFFFWRSEYATQYLINNFNGDLLHKVKYGKNGCLHFVRLTNSTNVLYPRINTGTIKIACDIWVQQNVLSKIMHFFIPENIKVKISKKCSIGCVDTCAVF